MANKGYKTRMTDSYISLEKSIIRDKTRFNTNGRMSVKDNEAMGDKLLGKDPRLAEIEYSDLVKALKFQKMAL